MDYQGNSRKERERASDKVRPPEKVIERVVASEVIVRKETLGSKFREIFTIGKFKEVSKNVVTEVLWPSLINVGLDAWNRFGEGVFYSSSAIRRRNYGGIGRPRITTYNTPINRGYGYSDSVPVRYAPPVNPGPRSTAYSKDEFIIATREEAEEILRQMIEMIDVYEMVSMADLKEMCGIQASYIDNKWGWRFLSNIPIRQIREGYLIDFPPVEPLPS